MMDKRIQVILWTVKEVFTRASAIKVTGQEASPAGSPQGTQVFKCDCTSQQQLAHTKGAQERLDMPGETT